MSDLSDPDISEIDRRDACPTVVLGIASVALLPRNDRDENTEKFKQTRGSAILKRF
jgi:hypothetical protein